MVALQRGKQFAIGISECVPAGPLWFHADGWKPIAVMHNPDHDFCHGGRIFFLFREKGGQVFAVPRMWDRAVADNTPVVLVKRALRKRSPSGDYEVSFFGAS